MKKILCLLVISGILLTSGCQKASTLMVPKSNGGNDKEATQIKPEDKGLKVEEVVGENLTRIPCLNSLRLTNDWTILGDYRAELTKEGVEDRVLIATSAKQQNGEMMWDDSQYWTVAVILDDHDGDGNNDGAYNLFASERIPGRVYMEVNEIYLSGTSTTVVTVYIFGSNDRQIRNYIFDGECFVERIEYESKNFSTGGISNMYSTFQDYKPY